MVYANIINTIGIKVHDIHNVMIKSTFRYIVGMSEEVKLAAWQKTGDGGWNIGVWQPVKVTINN